jgi:hypothetical protein
MANRCINGHFLLEIDHFLKKIVQSSDFCPHRFEISAKSCKVAILAHNLPSRLHGIAGCRPAHLMLPIRAGFGRLASFVAGRRTLCYQSAPASVAWQALSQAGAPYAYQSAPASVDWQAVAAFFRTARGASHRILCKFCSCPMRPGALQLTAMQILQLSYAARRSAAYGYAISAVVLCGPVLCSLRLCKFYSCPTRSGATSAP